MPTYKTSQLQVCCWFSSPVTFDGRSYTAVVGKKKRRQNNWELILLLNGF
ncbi:hypothetical protein COCNU_13G000040 [Cocos nucifera]|uniref:Uncharacterized protein n=1 Tax=Cocos nucifera TaxID=13894 RepID=A0A8K0IS52_COCNU|nr:hypothetical protein COCNU_13G000040 [Cocos nucifera]